MTRRYLTILFPLVVLVVVGATGCVPMKNPQTISDLQSIATKAGADANCQRLLAADAANTSTAKDMKSSRNLRDICDCWARSDGSTVETKACSKLAAEAVNTYEGEKR